MKVSEKYSEFIEYLIMQGYAEHSIIEYKRFMFGSLSHSIQDIEIENLKKTDTAKVIEAGRSHGEYGAQRSVVTLRRYLSFLEDSGFKLSFNWQTIKVPKVPQSPVEFLEADELEKIRNSLGDDMAGLRTRVLIEVLYDSGMRISEAIGVDKKDINWEKKEVKIRNAKTKEHEIVYLTERSIFWIKKYLARRKDDLSCLFVSGRARMVASTSRNYIRMHLSNLGINKHIKHHIFRKTFSTDLLRGGANIKEVQFLSRHKSERTTLKVYIGLNKINAKETHQRIMGQ